MGYKCLKGLMLLLIVAVIITGCNDKPTELPRQSDGETGKQINQNDDQTGTEELTPQPQVIALDPEDYGGIPLKKDRWEFTTVPDGANVYLDGKLVGRTPIIMEQLPPPGSVMTVIKEGYQWYMHHFGKEKPGARTINLTPGRWLSLEEIERAKSGVNLELLPFQEKHWQMNLGLMQVEQFSANPAGTLAAVVIERRIPENEPVTKVTTGLHILALIQFSPECKVKIMEFRPFYVGYNSFRSKLLGWIDNDRLLLLEGAPDPQGNDKFNLGLAIRVLNVVDGQKTQVAWIPHITAGKYLWDAWLSGNKDEVYFSRSWGYYKGAIEGVRLDTGEYRVIKKDLRLYRPFEELFLVKSPGGTRVVHLLNTHKDNTMPIIDLKTGHEVDLTPKGVVASDPVWSPDDSLVAVKVGEPGQPFQVISTEGGVYLEASSIWVVNTKGEKVARLGISGEHPGTPMWLPDGKNLVFQVLERIKLDPEEATMLPDDWKLAGREIYRASLDGRLEKIYSPDSPDYILERVLDGRWLLVVDRNKDGGRYLLLSSSGERIVKLPPETRQVLGMAGDRVVTWDDKKRICLSIPGEDPVPVASLDSLLFYHWIVNDDWLVLVDQGRHIDSPSSLKIIRLKSVESNLQGKETALNVIMEAKSPSQVFTAFVVRTEIGQSSVYVKKNNQTEEVLTDVHDVLDLGFVKQ